MFLVRNKKQYSSSGTENNVPHQEQKNKTD